MPMSVIEAFFSQLFASGRAGPAITVTWHSGEPLTLPPSYYDEAIALILRVRDVQGSTCHVTFDLQTNGVLINENWCAFFRRHAAHFELGVSCDGPAELHDAYRVNWSGQATHAKTMRGMEMLEAHGIPYNLIAVVTRNTLAHCEAFYDFFADRRERITGFHFNVLAGAEGPTQLLSYSAADRDAYYEFFRKLLNLTHASAKAGREFDIRNFSQGLSRIFNASKPDAPDYVEETSAPLTTVNLDTKGNVTTFYAGLGMEVLPAIYGDGNGFSLGNIFEMTLDEMADSEKLQRIMRDFEKSRIACKAACAYFGVCTGGFEITKQQAFGTFEALETTECVIHVKTMVDALLDDISQHLDDEQVV